MSKIKILLFLIYISFIYTLIVDINDDFNLEIEYRLEKQETDWKKRGKLVFRSRDPNTYKSTASLVDFNFNSLMKKEIQKECKLGGNYILQFTNENNITERYYTSINPCNLISTNFHDKLQINSFTPIEKNKIKSINYMEDEDYEEDYDIDEDEDEEVEKKQKIKKGGNKIELSQIKKLEGPIFAEEDDGVDLNTKNKKEKEKKQPQSFFGRYWYIIAIVMFMLMMNGGQPPEGAPGQGQGQGQNQGQPQGASN